LFSIAVLLSLPPLSGADENEASTVTFGNLRTRRPKRNRTRTPALLQLPANCHNINNRTRDVVMSECGKCCLSECRKRFGSESDKCTLCWRRCNEWYGRISERFGQDYR
ncbi:hypothetical protein PFISCL1PPCAC_18531, partial [Pristionchus fissidentatus]